MTAEKALLFIATLLAFACANAAPVVQATLTLGNNTQGIAVDPAIGSVVVTNFTLNADECAFRAANGWVLESSAFFYLMPTDVNGNCPAGTAPLFRLYNNGMGGAPNHRLTADIVTRNLMIALGWIPEGNGPLIIFACTPTLLFG